MRKNNKNRSKKITALFLLLAFAIVVFLAVMLQNALNERQTPSKYTSVKTKAKRGSIISADGFHLATTHKLYKVSVNTKNIDPDKRELFIKLFSIYSGMDEKAVRKKIASRRGHVVISYKIDPKRAQYLKTLAFELLRLHVFKEYETKNGMSVLQGLSLRESGETREYPYKKVLTPLIGYPRKVEEEGYTKVYGVKGIERSFEEELEDSSDGYAKGLRDVNNYMILNGRSITKAAIDGNDVKLHIPVTLQIKIERLCDRYKKELRAKEVYVVVMDSQSGKIVAFATSNRFDPKRIKRSEYSHLQASATEYSFEPGSVIKPITFSLLLDNALINPYDLVNGHNGRYKIGRKTITDEHRFDWLSAEDVIIYSSNVGIAQLAQKLDGATFYNGFLSYGFTQPSGLRLPYERVGNMPNTRQLDHEIYKAITGYGYGIRVNLMQLVRAYNVFNNFGRLVEPHVVDGIVDSFGRFHKTEHAKPVQIIKPATAKRMQKILIKTVNKGTGVKARTEGVVVGGKTGTAHIAEHGRYVRKYNSSFLGFANDETRRYTIGVTVVEPKEHYFASLTAVPVFKEIVDLLIDEGYLTPNYEKFKLPPIPKKRH